MVRLTVSLNGGAYVYYQCTPQSFSVPILNYRIDLSYNTPCSEGDNFIIKDRLTGEVLASGNAPMPLHESISAPNGVTIERGSMPSCSDDSDCEKGEKCVDGECVPCEKLVDGKGIVTLWGVQMSDGTITSDGIPVDISSGVASVHLSNFDSSNLTAGRIQISNGMSGTLTVKAGIGLLGSDSGRIVTGKQIGRAHV